MRPGLLKGEWEQGGLYTGPLSLGWLSCCHSVPWWAFYLPSLLFLTPLSPYSGHNPLPSVAPSTIFSSSGGAQPIPRQKPLPQTRGPEESLAPPLPWSLLRSRLRRCRTIAPVHEFPALSTPTRLPVTERRNFKKNKTMTHWWTTTAASSRP